jgi:capsular polysaccharide biosynthesis protein
MMKCLTCQARAFMNADVIIGSHGAGLSHTMFAKKGGILLERITGDGDSRIYAELAFLNQIKYFAMQNDAGAQAYVDVILFANSFS